MGFSLEELKETFPKQLCLGFSESDWLKAQSLADKYTNKIVGDRVFLNSLCLATISPALQDIYDISQDAINITQIQKKHEAIWQSLSGVAIDLPLGRLVLIPTEDLDTEELRVKREWLDSPALVGDFYLAVQVNCDQSWLRVWGFTSQKEFTERGKYDEVDDTWAIDRADLWLNIEAIPVILSEKIDTRVAVASNLSVATESGLSHEGDRNWNILSERIFSQVWQPFDELVAKLKMSLAVVRLSRFQGHMGRKIDLNLEITNHSLALIIGFEEEEDHKYSVQARLYPTGGYEFLPKDVELSILEANGRVFKEARSREADNWIQVEFKGKFKEKFKVKIQLEEVSIIEDFII